MNVPTSPKKVKISEENNEELAISCVPTVKTHDSNEMVDFSNSSSTEISSTDADAPASPVGAK